jgi:thiol-disulfide isomerase/thioredoxin
MKSRKALKFYSNGCGPCRSYAPIFDKVQSQLEPLGYEFESVDVDQDFEKAVEFKVKGVPTTVILHDGEVYKSLSGVLVEDQLYNLIVE